MSGLADLIRFLLLAVFYATPFGWVFLVGLAYISIVDWLTLPKAEFKELEEKAIKKNPTKGNRGLNDNPSMAFTALAAIFGISRLLGSGGSKSGGHEE